MPPPHIIIPGMGSLEDSVLKNLETFVAFARKRLNDAHLAEDVVQDSLLKALTADRTPTGAEATTAWFYRILRRSIIDLYRRQDAKGRALERFEQELSEQPSAEDEDTLCQCFQRLLPLVPEQYRELLQQIDLDGRKPEEVASELRLSRNNLTVRLHRARKHLRAALTQNCGACSAHGCLDCTCGDSSEPPHDH
jgi:RNA polymerase sigma factor (sigma-70 family)